jgi:metal-responsive CopG/Arc/MetJ family transcriptional regulator
MKTAISLPDTIFKQAERFARRSKKSRSKLYADAIAEYLARHSPDEITDSLNRIFDTVNEGESAFIKRAARQVIAGEAW